MSSNLRRLMQSATLALGLAALAAPSHADLVFDNVSNVQNAVAGASGSGQSAGNTVEMGGAYTLLAGTTEITGFDLFPVNVTSATNFDALQMTVFVWGTVNTGTVNAANPAFSNLLGTFTATSATLSDGYTHGHFFNFQSATSPGVAPGIALSTPIALNGSTTIGLTMFVQGSTDDGATFKSVSALGTLVTTGTPATVGSNVFNGFYRGNSIGGNFTSGRLAFSGATNQSPAFRVYGDVTAVPEPGTCLMLSLGLGLLFVARRRQHP